MCASPSQPCPSVKSGVKGTKPTSLASKSDAVSSESDSSGAIHVGYKMPRVTVREEPIPLNSLPLLLPMGDVLVDPFS